MPQGYRGGKEGGNHGFRMPTPRSAALRTKRNGLCLVYLLTWERSTSAEPITSLIAYRFLLCLCLDFESLILIVVDRVWAAQIFLPGRTSASCQLLWGLPGPDPWPCWSGLYLMTVLASWGHSDGRQSLPQSSLPSQPKVLFSPHGWGWCPCRRDLTPSTI